MADYVVRMTGQDNLSGTIKQVKSELNDLGKTTSKLDQIDKKFSKITNSTAPLKKQLRDLKTLMAQMNMDGLANTEQYTKIAQEAGKIKDAMDDAAASARRFSSDTASLDATIQAFQGIAAVGTIATGAMGLFGKESKEVEQAILKVQSALAILNGIQQVANVLNKNSALIEKLKGTVLRTNTAATVTNTTATAVNTAATVADTAATNRWNIAKAISRALLGDWKSLLLVGAAALVTYALTTSSAADAQEDLNKKNEEGTSIERDAIKSASEKIAKLQTLYSVTQDHTRSLKERNAAANEMRAMNPEILSGLSNEAILAGDAAAAYNEMAAAIIRVAEAEAAYERIKSLTAKKLELKQQDREFNRGIDSLNKNRKDAAASMGINLQTPDASQYVNPEIAKIDEEIDDITKEYGEGITKLLTGKSGKGSPRAGGGRSGGGRTGTTPARVEEAETGVLAQLNEELKKKQKLLDDENTSLAQQQQLLKEIADLQTKITRIQNARTAATDGTLADALKPQPLELTPEIDEKKLDESIGKLMARINAITGGTHFEIMQKQIEENNAKMDAWGDTASAIGQNFSVLGDIFSSVGDSAAAGMMQIAASTAQAVAQIIPQIMALIGAKQGQALAEGTASAAGLPFPANIAAIATIVASILSVFATIASVAGKFAGGGIVGGGSYYGDMVMARVNAGEMILNRRQQANLFRAIESGNIGAGQTVLVPEFKIKGSDLYGTLRNFSKSVGKTGKVTGIR